jgi:two-component system KDP operon response regulator KdpE
MHVLIAEDELATRKMLRFVFEQQAGRAVLEAGTGAETLQALADQECGLLLTDLSLPDMDGFELVRQVRRVSSIPIVIVSARGDVADRIRGLKCGADDYVSKPFDVSELLARVDALLWRANQTPRVERDGRLSVGPLVLEPTAQAVEIDGRGRVRLTPTEFRLLMDLARAPGKVRPRHELEQAIAGTEMAGTPGALNTYISTLRGKLETNPHRPRLIQTVRSRGYRLTV